MIDHFILDAVVVNLVGFKVRDTLDVARRGAADRPGIAETSAAGMLRQDF